MKVGDKVVVVSEAQSKETNWGQKQKERIWQEGLVTSIDSRRALAGVKFPDGEVKLFSYAKLALAPEFKNGEEVEATNGENNFPWFKCKYAGCINGIHYCYNGLTLRGMPEVKPRKHVRKIPETVTVELPKNLVEAVKQHRGNIGACVLAEDVILAVLRGVK